MLLAALVASLAFARLAGAGTPASAATLAAAAPHVPAATLAPTEPTAASLATAAAEPTPAPAASARSLGRGGDARDLAPLVVPSDAAEIVNTGSTNALGYRIVVRPGGAARAAVDGATTSPQIPAGLAAQLFADLAAASPLDAAARRGCMKSASFGSATLIIWHGMTTGDVSCPGGVQAMALERDAEAIARTAGLSRAFRHRISP